MSDPFIAEIVMFGGNFAPRGWALCDGQLLPINQNQALFSLLGTTFGGDGRTTFGLPEMRGRLPMHPGNGPGLSPRQLGQRSGSETETLTVGQLPAHNHGLRCSDDDGARDNPVNSVPAKAGEDIYETSHDESMAAGAIVPAGGGRSHSNLQPYLVVNFIIALFGVFPSRN